MNGTCNVSEVNSKVNKLPPILVSFEHGDVIPSEVAGLRCTVLQNKTNKERLVAVATSHLQHTSITSSSNVGLATTLIVVRNKKTNKVRLIETECFTLSPMIAKENKVAAESVDPNISVQYAQLSKSFGSKMAKRKQEQIEKTVIHADNLEAQLSEVTENVKVAEEELSFASYGASNTKELLPPFNPEAATSSEVYELKNILSQEEMESLDVVCDEIFANPDSYDRYLPSPLFTSCLPQVLATKDHTRLKALLYADCLTKFLCILTKDLSKKDLLLCPYSVHISNNILNNFTTKQDRKRNRSMAHKDKALCYIIVLGLLASNFHLNLVPVVESLSNIGLKKLQDLKRFVGAVPTKDTSNTITLKVPLPVMRNISVRRKSARGRK